MNSNEEIKVNTQLNTSQMMKKRPRRSKNDQIGRNKQCKYCEKRYLSYIALNIHVKTKHLGLVNKPQYKSKGRPKKSNEPTAEEEEPKESIFQIDFSSFFEKSSIRKRNEVEFDFIEICKESFQRMYKIYKSNVFKNTGSVSDSDSNIEYPFIDNAYNRVNDKTIDNSFWKYIEYVATETNKDYFEFVFRLIILFRECILESLDKGMESSDLSSENIPDYCNEFVCVYMERFNYFEMNMTEVINVIQHFCNWLWENQYTCLRLNLLS